MKAILNFIDQTGEVIVLLGRTLYWCKSIWRRRGQVAKQMYEVGNRSLGICALTACVVGMILSLQAGYQLKQYGAERALGVLVGLSIIKEFGPVITAFILAGRIGSSFAAEIGSMVVYEEVDALETMGVNPVGYLSMPRFVACVLIVPVLVVYADVIGLLGGALVGETYVGLRSKDFFDEFFRIAEWSDILKSLVKSVIFGGIIATIGCFQGFKTSGGPEGVGRTTTQSVVRSLLLILICDYFAERLML